MIGRNDSCWCGSGKKWKKCHFPEEPSLTSHNLAALYKKRYGIILKTPEQIAGIKAACLLAASILDETAALAKAGVTTLQLNDFANKRCLEQGAVSASLNYGYPPFPGAICTSLNEVVCHGIPDERPLQDGDILNIDFACILNGYFGDCSKMVLIGDVDEEKRHVCEVAYECLMRSIAILKPGVPVSAIGDAIQQHATQEKCSVVTQFIGHGVGLHFHEEPQIPHYRNHIDTPLAPGMIFTIEPMINVGVKECVVDSNDQWTARTKDGKPSAQWEHTLLITESGPEILTPWTK